jgi:hypothetical protein
LVEDEETTDKEHKKAYDCTMVVRSVLLPVSSYSANDHRETAENNPKEQLIVRARQLSHHANKYIVSIINESLIILIHLS